MIKFKFFNVFTIVLILLQAVAPIPALAMAGSDQPDYAPGSVVTFSGDNSNGAGYLPAETVHVDVSGPGEYAGSCEAAADEAGAWLCQVTLPADAADGTYDYTAAGLTSGVSESGSFAVTAPPPPLVEPPVDPTMEPTAEPTQEPTAEPTVEPTAEPTVVVTPAPAPFIQSDKADYAPAEVVTLTSGNWQPGEWVVVYVNDDIGQTWSITTNKQADANGAFIYQFELPDWFVATYRVTATGALSGVATTTFTDANIDTAEITIKQSDCATNSPSFAYNDTVCASVLVTVSGGGGLPSLIIRWYDTNSSTTPVRETTKINVAHNSTQTDAFQVTTVGTWTVKACKNAGCNGNNLADTKTFTVGKANQTITFGALTNKTYGDADFTVSATASSGLPVSFSSQTTSVCTVSGNTVHIVTAGTCTIRAAQAGNANYNAAPNVDQSFSVAKVSPTITWANPADITYGTALSGTQLNATASVPGSFIYTPASGTVLNAGNGQTLHVDFTPTDTVNYNNTSKDVTINVLKASSATIVACPASVTYDGTARTPCTATVTGVGGLNQTLAVTYLDNTDAGTANASATFAGDTNHSGSSDSESFTIDPATSETTIFCPASVTYDGTAQEPCTVSVTGAGGFSLSPDADYTDNVNAGTGTASYTYPGDANHTGSSDSETFTIDPAASETTVSCPASVPYDGSARTPCTVSVTGAGGLILSPDADYTDNVNAGTGTASYTYPGDANHTGSSDSETFTIDPAASETTVSCPASVTYDGTSQTTCTAEVTGAGGLSEVLTVTYADNVNAGTATASASYAGDANHTGSSDSQEFTIDPADSTTTVTCPASVTYNGAAQTPCTVSVTGVGGLSLSPDAAYTDNLNAGTATASYSYAGDANHNGSSDSENFTIAQAGLLVDAVASGKTYGDGDPAFSYTLSGFAGGDNAGNSGITGTASCIRTTGENVAGSPYTITCEPGTLSAPNYSFATGATADFTIGQATLTVTADDQDITYGDSDPTFAFQYSGFQLGDNENVVDMAPSCSVTGPHTDAGTYTISCSDGADDNYAFAYVDGTLTVDPAALTITADNKSRTYGFANPVLTASYSGFVNGDDEGDLDTPVSLSTPADETSPVGSYAITASAAADANYTITFVNGTLTVGPKALTITADDQSKVYGSSVTFTGTEFSAVGLVNADTVDSVSLNSTGAAATAAVSTYDIVASDAVGSGLDNYDISYVDGTLTVDAKALTITADDQAKIYGEAFLFDGTEFSAVGLVNADTVTSVTLTSAGAAATAIVADSPYAIVASDAVGSGLENYDITYVNGEFIVEAKALTITADNQTKAYGEDFTFDGNEFSAVGLVNTDTVDSVTLTSDGAAGLATVGSYAIVASNALGSGLDNYDISYGDGTFTVDPKPLTITADDQNKTYGNTLTFDGTEFTPDGLVNSDTVDSVTLFSDGAPATAGTGTYAIAASDAVGSGLGNYTISYVDGTLTVSARQVTVTADAKSKVYGEDEPELTYQITGGSLANGDSFTGGLVRVSGEDVDSYDINQGNLALSSNYNLSFVGAQLTITQATLTVTADPQSKIYGDISPTLTFAYSGFQFSDDASVLDVVPVCSTTAGQFSDVGSYPITCSGGMDNNYTFSYVGSTLTINQRPATVTADAQSKIYGDDNPELTATVENTVNGDILDYSLATDTEKYSDVGDYPITVTLGTNPNYAVTSVDGILSITPATLTVTADAQTRVYGQPNPGLTFAYSGFLGTDNASDLETVPSCSTAALQYSDVGGYPITCSGGDDNNYSLSYVDSTLSITQATLAVTANFQTKIYGQPNPGLTFAYDGFLGTNGPSVLDTEPSCSTTAGQFSDVGSYPITCSGGMDNNYAFSYADNILSVTQATLTVTAEAKSKTYGDANPPLTFVYGPFQGTDTASVLDTEPSCSTAALQYSDVGGYPIICSGGEDNNYSLSYVDSTLTINKKTATVTASDKTRTYGDANPAFDAAVAGEVAGGAAIQYTLATTAAQLSNVGGYPIVVTLGDNPNYDVTPVNGTLTIEKKEASVTADNKNKTYGEANPLLTATVVDEVVGGDAINYSLSTAATQFSNVGDHPITVTLGANPNYDVTQTDGTLTIETKSASVTANDKTRTYGDANPAFDAIVVGEVTGGDAIGYSLSTAADQLSNVGDYAIVVTLGANPNYDISFTDGTLTINQRPATVTADTHSKTYGDDNPELTSTVDNIVNGDVLDYSLSTTAVKLSDVGPYPITVTLGTNPNYAVTVVDGTLTIEKKSASVTAVDKSKIYGDDNPALTASVSGQVPGGSVIDYSLATTALQLSNVGDYPITVTLGSNPNYEVTPADGTLTINRKAASITADAKSKTYADDSPALSATVVGQVPGGDVISYSLATTAVKLSNAGNYPITVTLGANPNYDVTQTDGTLTVDKAVLTVTADNKSKYFAGPDPAFTFQYSGFVNGETASVVDTPPTCDVTVDHAAVGTYPIVCSGGLDNNYSFTYINGTLTVAAWEMRGFYSPVDMGGSLTVYNTVKGGSTVPLKFEIFSGTTELTDVGALQGLSANQISCTSGAIEDPISVTATGGTVLRYDSTSGQFIFNWQTPKKAGFCYRVWVTADDGSYKEAFFKLK